MILTGAARIAGVMGWPVAHSLSPRLHGHWLERYGIDGAYIPLAVPPEGIETALHALPALGLRGVNVTLPHKEAALLACDEVEAGARRIGAVNTILVRDGRLHGSNSDGFGFLENLRQAAPAWRADSGLAVVLGAGGAARAVVAALLDAGASEIRLLNRTQARAETLAAEILAGIAGEAWGGVACPPWAERAEALAGAGLLVNTTQLGMAGQAPLELALDDLPPEALVNDIVYKPLETPLLAAARARGNQAVDGLGMLLHQARPGFEAWFGRRPEVDEALRGFVLGGLG